MDIGRISYGTSSGELTTSFLSLSSLLSDEIMKKSDTNRNAKKRRKRGSCAELNRLFRSIKSEAEVYRQGRQLCCGGSGNYNDGDG